MNTKVAATSMNTKVAVTFLALFGSSVNAQSVEFVDGLPFTGFEGNTDCEAGTEFLSGKALSLTLVGENAVCEETEYTIDGETFVMYTGIVMSCLSTGVAKSYYICNEGCDQCDDESFQFGTESWDDDGPCYSNTATVPTENGETVVLTSSWSFDSDADKDSVESFLDFVLDNTCIGEGQPEIVTSDPLQCLTYSDYICQELDEGTPYALTTACSIFKDLGGIEPFNSTLFIPTDAAFETFGELLEKSDTDRLDEDMIMEIVTFHGSWEAVLYVDLICGETIEMWNGVDSRTKCMNSGDGNLDKYQKGGGNRDNHLLPLIVVADVLACGGNIIHIVSEVMLPNDINKIKRI